MLLSHFKVHFDFPAPLAENVVIIYSSDCSLTGSLSRGLFFSFVLFDLAEIPHKDLRVLKCFFSSRHSDIERGSRSAAVTSLVVAPTPLSDSLFLSPLFR